MKVTPSQIEAAIVRQDFFTAAQGVEAAAMDANHEPTLAPDQLAPDRLRQVTLCVLTLANGHVSVGVNYGPVDPAEFDEAKAREMARAHAVDQLWPLFGFALREQLTHTAAAIDLGPVG